MRYIITEKELLRIVETLKHFRSISLSQILRIYTDHKNLACVFKNNDIFLIRIVIIEEYVPDIEYI